MAMVNAVAGRAPRDAVVLLGAAVLGALIAVAGCREPAAPDAAASTQPAEPRPKRPADSWTIFRAAYEPEADADCTAKWTGGDRLEVHTQNIRRLTLDLTRLPEGAPREGPWNLQIDRQGIEITGARGKVLDLVRSRNGIWSVDAGAPATTNRAD